MTDIVSMVIGAVLTQTGIVVGFFFSYSWRGLLFGASIGLLAAVTVNVWLQIVGLL